MINIEYTNLFTNQKNNNLIFFISKYKELNNISFDTSNLFNIKNKSFQKKLEKDNKIVLDSINNDTHCKIIIILLDVKKSNFLNYGSSLIDDLDFNHHKNIIFYFSNRIKNNFNIISDIIFGFNIKLYKFDKYLKNKFYLPSKIIINIKNKSLTNKIKYSNNLLYAINLTKDLISEPANVLNPVSYSKICKNIKIKGLKIKELELSELKKIGMNSLLAVSQGSKNEPRVIVMEWNLKKGLKPTVLAGKGVTFDTGGISLKPPSGMEEMLTDMSGSAVVVGSMVNAALNKINKSLIGIIGLVENMPGSNAQRPGDIVKSLSGQTIEVINTDAEGRMVLADIITYVQQKYKPSQIIDFATLTGAIMIALGTHKAGLFSNDDKLSDRIIKSGKKIGEHVWRLPLGSEYDLEINSLRADMKNVGSSRYGGSIHAAEFIHRFVYKGVSWAHLDIAGVSWTMKGGQNNITNLHNPGATAFGVRLIDNFFTRKKK